MAGVSRFEDLIAWQKARTLTAEIQGVIRSGPLHRAFGLADQMRDAAVSVMSNISEGFERDSPAEFNRFLGFARSSCAEVRSHLYAALDAGYLGNEEFDRLMALARSTSEVVSALKLSVLRRMTVRAKGLR